MSQPVQISASLIPNFVGNPIETHFRGIQGLRKFAQIAVQPIMALGPNLLHNFVRPGASIFQRLSKPIQIIIGLIPNLIGNPIETYFRRIQRLCELA